MAREVNSIIVGCPGGSTLILTICYSRAQVQDVQGKLSADGFKEKRETIVERSGKTFMNAERVLQLLLCFENR